MQKRNRTHTLALGLAAALIAALCASPALSVPIEWVTVGSPNATKDSTGHGAVGYEFQMSRYETTNAQYVEFLNAVASKEDVHGLYNANMSSSGHGGITRQGPLGSYSYSLKTGMDNKPVNYVSFYDTLRFANWLNNGKGGGDTESGAYSLGGTNPVGVVRNAGASIFLPTEDEWYKAAFYDAATGTFLEYPTGSDGPFTCSAPTSSPNTGNCNNRPGGFVEIGSYPGSASPFGTFDQGGNAFEWVDAGNPRQALRGGGFIQNGIRYPSIAGRWSPPDASAEFSNGGFRISAYVVPEPSTGVLVSFGMLWLTMKRRLRWSL